MSFLRGLVSSPKELDQIILRYFENTATYHSDSIGGGIKSVETTGRTWIVLDWRVKVLKRVKYGEKEYQKYISYVIKQDVLKETGSIHLAKKEQVKYVLNKFFTKSIPAITKGILVSSALVIALTPAAFGHFNQNIIAESTEVYAEQISDYNQNAIEYANKINQIAGENNFSDLDIIMKVVSDMWKEIDGYGEPELDAFGYYRLDIENGVGMCRHMADDIAYKLNEINKDFI